MAFVSWLASLDLIILTFKVQTIGKHLVGWFLRGRSKLKHVKCSELCLENSECSINVVIGTFVYHQNNVYHHYHHCTRTSSSVLSVNQNLFLRPQPCNQHYPSFPEFEPRLIYQSAGTTDLCVTVMVQEEFSYLDWKLFEDKDFRVCWLCMQNESDKMAA